MNEKTFSSVIDNYQNLLTEVGNTADKCGRSIESIKIVLVTKHQTVEKINAAIEAGATQLAENYPELLLPKLPDIIDLTKIKWHMIGHIQSRKANLVMDHFDYVHSINNLNVAQRLQKRGLENKRTVPVLIEVNLSEEAAKNGYRLTNPSDYETFLADVREISNMTQVKLRGLMVMPPFTERAEDSRKYFSGLRMLLDKVNVDLPEVNLTELSMGTSQDYQIAIEEGATLIRIGTLVFGERK